LLQRELHRHPAAHRLPGEVGLPDAEHVEHVGDLVDQRRDHLRVVTFGLGAAVPQEVHGDHAEVLGQRGDVAGVVLEVAAGAVEQQ
jgi:hypothetical protein